MVIHNSALAEYRSPVGALKTNESALIRFEASGVGDVKLYVFNHEVNYEYKMHHTGKFWHFSFPLPSAPTVLWYYFTYEHNGNRIYYCARDGYTQGEGFSRPDMGQAFQLTVYSKDFKTPRAFKNGRMYQIFPDRFANGDHDVFQRGVYYHLKMRRNVVMHKDFDDPVLYTPIDGAQYYSPCDFYGGNLKGITKSLPKLAALSVNVIYLNPIFEAESNHRYDTADYMQVDPILGSNEDFVELCTTAKKYNIKIILDGVFSHTGSDSRYFNKKENYDEFGAWQGKDSPFYNWYSFNEDGSYKSWWGFDTLPEVDEHNKEWIEFIITGTPERESVLTHWLNLGASGFRLDVADELPDETIELIRKTIKQHSSENILIGEVWEDATTKESYGSHRTYALGKGLDSVMNYPFRSAVLSYLRGWSNAYNLADFLTSQRLNYPPPMYYSLMNLVSSHDVPRVRTILATGVDGEGMSREEQAEVDPTLNQDKNAGFLQRIAGVLQYTIPGIPSLYYGDEYGMHGLKDPFNRAPLVKGYERSTYLFFKWIANLRKDNAVLKTGYCSFLALSHDVMAVLRFCFDGEDYFGVPIKNDCIIALINRSQNETEVQFSLDDFKTGIDEDQSKKLAEFAPSRCIDLETTQRIALNERMITASIPKTGYKIIKLN